MKNKLLKLFQEKAPRYISKQYIISLYGNIFWEEFCEKTSFLPENFPLVEKMFCICNDISKQPTCLTCNNPLEKHKFNSFNDSVESYTKRYCCNACKNNFEYDMKMAHTISEFDVEQMRIIFENADKKSLRRNFQFLNHLKNYLTSIKVDYTKMNCKDALYFFQMNLKEYPKCKKCGNEITAFGDKNSYIPMHCGNKCSANSLDTINKRLQTVREKYNK